MMITRKLSTYSKELIKESREVALNLGDDFISTVHLFLADCRLNKPYSIKYFAFDDDNEWNNYYENHKSPHPVPLSPDDDLLLTKEAESTLRNSALESYLANDKEIQPWHIFIAALKTPDTLLAKAFSQEPDPLAKLKEYYHELGLIDPIKKPNLFKRLIAKSSDHLNLIRFLPD